MLSRMWRERHDVEPTVPLRLMGKGSDYSEALALLKDSSRDHARLRDAEDWRAFKKRNQAGQFLYLYRFGRTIFAWGTSTGTNDRVRKACMFDSTLTGKYDRRVDFLMLRLIHRDFEAWAFCTRGHARTVEATLRRRFEQSHCYRGFPNACCRFSISRSIHAAFRRTGHYRRLGERDRRGFEQFMREVFFARRPLRKKPNGVTFKYGDTLEPWFLREIGHPQLEPAIEAALKVRFPEPGSRWRSPL